MLVLILIVVAAALLVHGVVVDQSVEVLVALALSLVSIAVVVGARWLQTRSERAAAATDDPHEAAPDPASDPAPEPLTAQAPAVVKRRPKALRKVVAETAVPPPPTTVVFAPGRTTFHRAECSSVAGKPVSSAEREQLEAGGMTACRRCL